MKQRVQNDHLSNPGLIKTAFMVVLLQILLSAFAWMLVPNHSLYAALGEIVASFVLALAFIYLNNKHGRAIFAHMILSMMFGIIVLTFVEAEFSILLGIDPSNWWLLAISLILLCLVWMISCYLYLGRYDFTGDEIQRTGRIKLEKGYWNLNKPLNSKDQAAQKKSGGDWKDKAIFVLPLASILGLSLYRTLHSPLMIYAGLDLLMALTMILPSGTQAAIAIELLQVEKTLHKKIFLYWS